MPSTDTDSSMMPESAVHLSQTDVEQLLTEDSAETRIAILHKISTHYCQHAFQSRELLFAEQIFRLLMKDTQEKVRVHLAEALKDNPKAPRDVMLHLANDSEAVSIPVLAASDVLSDADLIHIIETSREISKLLAVTQRGRVSGRVSHSLVETHYPQVVTSLLKNDGAMIEPVDYQDILRDFAGEEAVITAMVQRANLPLPVVEKLIHNVSDSVAAELESRYQLEADQWRNKTREGLTLELLSHHSDDAEIEETIAQMLVSNRLTPSIILSSLCRGYVRFFEIALAKLAKVPKSNARKLIHDRGQLGFPAIYEKTGLPDSMFEAVQLLLRVVLEMEESEAKPSNSVHYANAIIDRLLQSAGDQEVDNLPYIIALVRQSATH